MRIRDVCGMHVKLFGSELWARRRGLAVIVSDFPGSGTWVPALRNVVARHETVAVEVLDPRELDLPDVGTLVVADTETGEQREIRTSDAGLRHRYAEATRAQRRAVAMALRERATDHLVLRTDRVVPEALCLLCAVRARLQLPQFDCLRPRSLLHDCLAPAIPTLAESG